MLGDQIKIGYIILAHQHPEIVIRLSKLLLDNGGIVSIHYDKKAGHKDYQLIQRALESYNENVVWAKRARVGWGSWSIIQATLNALEALCTSDAKIDYVHLMSGSDYPIKPLDSFKAFLSKNYGEDFIECADMMSESWVQGGLTHERYLYRHYFNWKTQRWLFDNSFAVQKRLKLVRQFPRNISPHLGSQWWTLTWEAVQDVIAAGRDKKLVSFFKSVWIPDEMFIQSVVASSGRKISSHSNLTLYQFNDKGNPLVYHNDHAPYLLDQPFFFARKISPYADELRTRINETIGPNHKQSSDLDLSIGKRTSHYMAFVERWAYPQPNLRLLGYDRDHWYGDLVRLNKPVIVVAGTNRRNIRDVVEFMKQNFFMHYHGCLFDENNIYFEGDRDNYAGYSHKDVSVRDNRRVNFLHDIIEEDSRTAPTCFALPWGGDSEIIDRLVWIRSVRFIFVHGDALEAIAVAYKKLNRVKRIDLLSVSSRKGRVLSKLSRKEGGISLRQCVYQHADYNKRTLPMIRSGNCQLTEIKLQSPSWTDKLNTYLNQLDFPIDACLNDSSKFSANHSFSSKPLSIIPHIYERILRASDEENLSTLSEDILRYLGIRDEIPGIVICSSSSEEGEFISSVIEKLGFDKLSTDHSYKGSTAQLNECNKSNFQNSPVVSPSSGSTLRKFVLVSPAVGANSYVDQAIARRKSSLIIKLKGNVLRGYKEFLVREIIDSDHLAADKYALDETSGKNLLSFVERCERHHNFFTRDFQKSGVQSVEVNLLRDDWFDTLLDGLRRVTNVDAKASREICLVEINNLSDPYKAYENPSAVLSSVLRGDDLEEQMNVIPRKPIV